MTLPKLQPLPYPQSPGNDFTGAQMQAYAEQYGRLCAEAERERLKGDAENWGNALNDAGWEFMDSYRRHMGENEPPRLFNSAKSILRDCIARYFANLQDAAIRARGETR